MSESEERASPEVQEQQEEQPATPETTQEPVAEPEAEPQPEATEPEATSEEKPAEGEPEGDKPEGEAEKTEEGKTEEEQATEEAPAEAEKEEEPEPEEPIVITPEGNPHWLSTEDVLAKGLPESEVENFKYFYFKHAHSIQAYYESLKDCAVQTEFITLSKEEIEALTAEGDVSEDQQQILNGLQERINAVIELYEEDGALVKINGKTAKDAILEKTDESFVETIRDAVINSLEFEKQSICAYSIWKDQEHQPGVFKRGINKIRASFRRSRTGSAARRRPKLEEEKKDEDAAPEEGKAEGGEEPKPSEEGSAPPAEGGEAEGEAAAEVTVEVDVEQGEDKPAAEQEEPKEEAKAEDEPKQEEAPAETPAEEEPKEEAKDEEPKQEEAPAEAPATEEPKEEAEAEKKPTEEDGEIQAADKEEGGEQEAADGEEVKSKPKRKSTRKQKPAAEEHQHKAAKTEPLDNRVLRAFGRVMGTRYQVKDGKAALDQLRSSVHIRNDLNKLKAFGGVEGVQVSLSVCRWLPFIPEQTGMMFRAFVYENELTALSQYNDTTYFPNVVHYKDTVIRGKVQQFFQDSIKESLKDLNNYIVDIFVAPEKMYVIRLNPFHTNVGACLFTWNEHARVLTKGPFEFRTVDAPKVAPEAYSSYQSCWQEMLNSVLNQRKTESRPKSACVIL